MPVNAPLRTEASASAPSPSSSQGSPAELLARMKRAAFSAPPPSADERIGCLERLARGVVKHQDAIATAIGTDFGHRSRHETLVAEVYGVLSAIRHAKAHLREWMEDEPREPSFLFVPASARVVRQPLGVVGILSPWNYPVQLAFGPLVCALAAGNRVLIKPSERTPRTAALMAQIVADAFEPDLVAVVQGDASIAEAFAKLPFDHLVFTGSTQIGKQVMRAASENLVSVTLELGGKCPAIVGDDFDLATAAVRIMFGKTFNAGQTCVAPDYALVPEGRRDAFVDACRNAVRRMFPTLAGNPDYTAVIDDRHHSHLRALLDDARSHGATLVELNPASEALEPASRKLAPTLIVGATDAMLCLQEEIFGPILPVVAYGSLEDAISYVNDRPRPLALYYFGHRDDPIDAVLKRTTSGGVTLNDTLLHFGQDDLPFGGVGASGMGQYHGRDGFERMTHRKAVLQQHPLNATGLLRPPFGKALDGVLRMLIGR